MVYFSESVSVALVIIIIIICIFFDLRILKWFLFRDPRILRLKSSKYIRIRLGFVTLFINIFFLSFWTPIIWWVCYNCFFCEFVSVCCGNSVQFSGVLAKAIIWQIIALSVVTSGGWWPTCNNLTTTTIFILITGTMPISESVLCGTNSTYTIYKHTYTHTYSTVCMYVTIMTHKQY